MITQININEKKGTNRRRTPLLLFIFCILIIFITDTVVAQSPVPHKKQQALNLIKQKLPPTYAIISSEPLYLDTMEYTHTWISNLIEELQTKSDSYLEFSKKSDEELRTYIYNTGSLELDSTVFTLISFAEGCLGYSLAYKDAIQLLKETLYLNNLMELVPFYYIRLTIRDGYGENREVVYFLDTTMTLVTNNSEYFFDAIKPE